MPLSRRDLLLSSAAVPLAAHAVPRRLRIPHVSPKAELQRSYAAVLLEQALAAAGMPVSLEPTSELIPQNRALQELGSRRRLDVVWTMTSVEREQQALPIRVPLFKGLFGWRLLLATPEVAERMRNVQTLSDLRQFSMVQGHEWPDTGILQANGIPVVISPNYDAMFKQLRLGRVDCFPRSVEEIWWELERHGQGLVVVPNLCLHYPAAVYYFVAPDDAVAEWARLEAARRNTSVSRLLGELLAEKMQHDDAYERALQDWLHRERSWSSDGQPYPGRSTP